jgi:hypothetical protein
MIYLKFIFNVSKCQPKKHEKYNAIKNKRYENFAYMVYGSQQLTINLLWSKEQRERIS